MNIARLFSYTRQVEDERDRAIARVAKLEADLDLYRSIESRQPTPDMVRAKVEREKQPPQSPARRPSLQLMRRAAEVEGLRKLHERNGVEPPDAMKVRADEYAEKVKAN